MEVGNNHRQGSGFVKSMLVISFYKAAKPSPLPRVTKIKPKPSATLQKVSFTGPSGSFPSSDGYVHGPNGAGGDKQVDSKASSYISLVKERLRREELSITNENTKDS